MVKKSKARPICPNAENHTPSPSDYVQWHTWAAEMGQTHHTIQCPGCGLWAIWVPGAEDQPEGNV